MPEALQALVEGPKQSAEAVIGVMKEDSEKGKGVGFC